jgi:choloylglycine hydrolase
MCTSITLETKGNNFLARTMDFGFELDARIVYAPRDYSWYSDVANDATHTSKYGFVGAGKKIGHNYFFADGINEHGLAIAELYYPNEAKYHDTAVEGKVNVAPHELIMWILGNLKDINELEKRIDDIRLVSSTIEFLGGTPPLHYIVYDRSGRTVTLESESGELLIKNNEVGVMTNSPDLNWHIQNLNNYIYLQNTPRSNKTFKNIEAHAFGQGSGTQGLPGGYTPPERFVRALFLKESLPEITTAKQGVNSIYHVLGNLDIPKGAVIKADGALDYTQYISVMSVNETAYYIRTYDNPEIKRLSITKDMLETIHEVKEYPLTKEIEFYELG